MTTINMKDDIPCVYPSIRGSNITTGIGNTEKVLASFRNLAPNTSVRGILKRLGFMVLNSSADTLVTIQIVNGSGQSVGGTWIPVSAVSELEVNPTATSYSGGAVAVTMYSHATVAHGNTPSGSGLTDLATSDLGLTLHYGGQFAIVASTSTVGATVDIAWSVNWTEID